ncbi:MAG: PIG-L family deacetylase [Candidatus Pacearchaeota archaeon]|jgi:LmbE family N-acetylglucosaminyl deacetylase
MNHKSSIIFSPHSDDTVLSTGGRILTNYENESFSVLNIFSTCAFSILPELKNPKEITKLNNLEENEALGRLGINVEFMYLPEVLLRGYKHWNSPPDSNKEIQTKTLITSKIKELSKIAKRVYFPLGVGNHTDHILVNQIALESYKFLKGNVEVFFYEDIPYAFEFNGVEKKVGDLQNALGESLEEVVSDISPEIMTKSSLIGIYKTQYDEKYIKMIADYSESISKTKGVFHERAWKII